jgi:opine dehydrogenase
MMVNTVVEKIAVLGAGNGGHAASADLALGGYEVNLWEFPFLKDKLEPIQKQGGILITGAARTGLGKLNKVTTDIKEAIEGVDLIISTMPAFGHHAWAEIGAKYLEDGQMICFFGKGGCALEFAQTLKNLKIKKNLILGDTNTLPYVARIWKPANVRVMFPPKRGTFVATFPATDTNKLLNMLKKLYAAPFRAADFWVPAVNDLHTLFLDYNAMGHPPGMICNAGYIEYTNGNIMHWDEGYTPAVARYNIALEKERNAIMKVFGLEPLSYSLDVETLTKITLGALSGLFAPPLTGRYVVEDTPYGLVCMALLADVAGVEVPVIRATIKISEALLGVDFWKPGEVGGVKYVPRTLDRLGIAGMTISQINKFVNTGKI